MLVTSKDFSLKVANLHESPFEKTTCTILCVSFHLNDFSNILVDI